MMLQVFLGQKYGYRPLPTIIPANELEMLCEVIARDQLTGAEIQLLQQWYKKDENSIEPIYVLQTISSILTNFKNKVIPLPKKLTTCYVNNKNLAIANRSRVSCINTNNNTMTLKSGLEVTQGH